MGGFLSNWSLSLLLLAIISIPALPATAQRAIMEGVPSTRYAIKVDTTNGRVDIATTSYTGGVANTGLFVASNVVVGTLSNKNAVVIYATGTLTALTGVFGTQLVSRTGASGATAHVNADEIVAEGSGNAGISILTPNTAVGAIFFGDPQDATIGQIFYTHNADSMTFQTTGGVRMTIGGNGYVGIGTVSPATPLHVVGAIRQTDTLSCTLGLKSDADGTITGCVASSRTIKKDISDSVYTASVIDKLRPRYFEYINPSRDGGGLHAGFIAEEVEEVFPRAVVPAGENLKGVDAN